jgi:TRAP-type mannitol/chloroaromatic compound transport system permease small subunit
MPLTLFLLLLQGVSEFLKAVWTLRHNVSFQKGHQ